METQPHNSCQCLRFTDTAKYLGIFFDNYITLNVHINNITSSCYHFIRKLSSIRKFLSRKDCETLVHAFLSSRLDSSNAVLFGVSRSNIGKLQKVQNAAIRLNNNHQILYHYSTIQGYFKCIIFN